MIVECIGVYGERVDQALVGINRLRKAGQIDRTIVIVDESVSEEQKKKLMDAGCEVYFHAWQDSMVKMRNQYLEKVQTDDWVVVHDPDEWFNDLFCQDIRQITSQAERAAVDLVLINSHDTFIGADGKSTTNVSDFYKNLIYKKRVGTHYVGVGEIKEVHEQLVIPGMQNQARIEQKYFYEHVKYWWEVWERAARNVFMAGGGNNVGQKNTSWLGLRDICDELGLKTWPKAREYFRAGKIDGRLKDWLWANRQDGWDYEHEMMEFGRWYFEYLHPEEAEGWQPITELKKGSAPEIMRYVEEQYIEVLGRHADQEGKVKYMEAILKGEIKREDVPNILKASPEYQQKQNTDLESVKVQIPIDVSIRVSEDIILRALTKSKAWGQAIKPKLDVGSFFELALGPEKWREFLTWFYGTQPGPEDTLTKLKEFLA